MSYRMKRNIVIFLFLAIAVFPLLEDSTDAKKKDKPWERLGELLRQYTASLLYWTGLKAEFLFTIGELEDQLTSILETITGYNHAITRHLNTIKHYTSVLTSLAKKIGTLSSEVKSLDSEIAGLDATISAIDEWLDKNSGTVSGSLEAEKRKQRSDAVASRDSKKVTRKQKAKELSDKEYLRQVAMSAKWVAQQYLDDVERAKSYAEGRARDIRGQIASKKAKLPDLEKGIQDANTNISNTTSEIARLEAEQRAAEEAARQQDNDGENGGH